MKLLRQVMKDLRRELAWLLLYGVLASMVFDTLPGLIGSLSSGSLRQLQSMEEDMRRANLSMIRTKSIRIGTVPDEARIRFAELPEPYRGRPLRRIIEEGFSREGRLGCWAIEYERETNEPKYVYFVGKYVDLAPIEVPTDCDYYICASEDDADLVGKTVTVFGEELPVSGVVPGDAMIYHPISRYSAENLKGALFVFIRDYESVRRLFWYSHITFVNDNLIAVGADKAELAELVSAISRETGKYAYVQTMEEYLGGSTQRMRQYTDLLFRFGAVFALITAMVLNISRAIRRWEGEYSIHRLFGAPEPFVFARMLLFGFGYNLIAIGFIWYKTLFPSEWTMTYYSDGTTAIEKARGAISPAAAVKTAETTGLIAAVVLAVCIFEFLRFKKKFAKGMRGE